MVAKAGKHEAYEMLAEESTKIIKRPTPDKRP